jgi:ligand-binding sensor domain-containing protein
MRARRFKIKSYLFLFLLLAVGTQQYASAQASFRLRNFTTREGLSDDDTRCMIQDRRGYLWVGTRHGLNQYNGYGFRKFLHTPGDTLSIASNFINCLLEDRKGRIWIGLGARGMSRYDPATGQFRHYAFGRQNSKDQLGRVYSLYQDRRGVLWAGTSAGLSRYDESRDSFASSPTPWQRPGRWGENLSDVIYGFADDEAGGLWITSQYGLYYRSSTGRLTRYLMENWTGHPQASNLFGHLVRCSDSTLWIGSWSGGLVRFDIKTKHFTSFLLNKELQGSGAANIVYDICRKTPGEWWIASDDQGLGIFNETTELFQFLQHKKDQPESPPATTANTVITDKEGNLWAGFPKGLSYWQQPAWNVSALPLPVKNGAMTHTTNAFWEDKARHLLYAGTCCNGNLYSIRLEAAAGAAGAVTGRYALTQSLQEASINALAGLGPDTLIALLGNQLRVFNRRTNQYQPLALKDQHGKGLTGVDLEQDRRSGMLWLNDRRGKLFAIDAGLKAARSYTIPGLPELSLSGDTWLIYAEGDTLWLSDQQLGLLIYDWRRGLLQKPKFVQGFYAPTFFEDLVRDNKGHYWGGTYEDGVYEFWQQAGEWQLRHFTTTEGLASDFIEMMFADTDGGIWAQTRRGPAKLAGGRFQNLAPSFPSNDGWEGSRLFYTSNGMLATSGDGLLYLAKSHGIAASRDISFFLKSLRINGADRSYRDRSSLNLTHTENFIQVEYEAVDLGSSATIRYAHKLDGLDTGWIDDADGRSLSFAGLAPGHYTLWLQAHREGQSSTIKINFHISPPIWARWWFYALAALFVGGSVGLWFRYRIRQVRLQEAERRAFDQRMATVEMKALRAQMNPHFIFNCLNSINWYIVKSDAVTASAYLTRFARLVRLILDNSAQEWITVTRELELLQLYVDMERMRFTNRFTCHIELSPGLETDSLRISPMLIQPYVENAIWHGLLHRDGAGRLIISAGPVVNGLLQVVVEDDGIGRVAAAALRNKTEGHERSLGMQITRERLAASDTLLARRASVEIQDLYNDKGMAAGTRVTIQIPLEGTVRAATITTKKNAL